MLSTRWPSRTLTVVAFGMLAGNLAVALLLGGHLWGQVIGSVGAIVLLALGTIIGNAIADRSE